MRKAGVLLVAAVCFAAVLLAPGNARAMDELKNDDPDKYYILLDLRNHIVTVYERDENGEYTKIVRQFLCASGRTEVDETDPEDEATPTPRGIWKIGGRERFGKFADFNGEYARYWVQIVGSIFFHSIMFGNRTVNSLKRTPYYDMGKSVSHGCVRLYVEDAKWLYYYACPGTTIEISTTEPRNNELRRALKSDLSFSEYNALQKTITDDAEELPNPKAWVTVAGARLRKGSGSSFDSIKRLSIGDELEVLLDSEVWVKVRIGNREGYVRRGYISYVEGEMDTSEDATLVRSTQWLYTGPDEASEQICKMPSRVSVKVLETTEDGWTKLQYQNEVGYVRSSRLTTGWGVIMD
jgi:hypothetical protein